MMQGSATQMPQAHMMGINQMNPGSVTSSNIPPAIGGFANPMANIQGASTSGLQNFQIGGVFNLPQGGQMAPIPGLNAYQVRHSFLPLSLMQCVAFMHAKSRTNRCVN